nr:hypothetical protein [Tanacetum cinerariifolium]
IRGATADLPADQVVGPLRVRHKFTVVFLPESQAAGQVSINQKLAHVPYNPACIAGGQKLQYRLHREAVATDSWPTIAQVGVNGNTVVDVA